MFNMLFAIRTIQQRTGKDLGATFLSGTTISNSLTELYLLFKYLCPNELERQGIRSFDAWAAVFARKSIDYEFSVTNEIVQKERFRYFIKVPELASFYSEITDFRTAEDAGAASHAQDHQHQGTHERGQGKGSNRRHPPTGGRHGETAGQTEMEDEALSGIQQKGLATTGTCRIVAKPFYTENSIYSSLSKKRFKS